MKPVILAIDDSKAIRFLLQTIFGKKYQVITAADASSAMYWLSQKNFPDVIITNAALPDTENWEFVSFLRDSFMYKDIPTVVLASLPEEEVATECARHRIEKFFLKPFNPLTLVEAVDELASLNVSKNDVA